jgi:sugar phosphate isomerase/epimerase
MARPVTLFTGQWADLPLETLAEKAAAWGFDGLELATWGDHFDVSRAEEPGYLDDKRALLERHGLGCWTISAHLVGQCVCDHPLDGRHEAILPSHVWGDGNPEGVRSRAADEVKATLRAAARFGVSTVTGFTGSSIWHTLAGFPPVPPEMIDAGYEDFAERWNPIVDVADEVGVRFALEVHPSEIAYDFWTTARTLEAIGHRPGFGLNFDPSHMAWQRLDPDQFLEAYADRIYHVHAKDTKSRLDGRSGVLASHLGFGDLHRGWDFVSVGHGDVDFERITRRLNAIGYDGPVSIEWEDSGMDREQGAPEALEHIRRLSFGGAEGAFDSAFASSAEG